MIYYEISTNWLNVVLSVDILELHNSLATDLKVSVLSDRRVGSLHLATNKLSKGKGHLIQVGYKF